MLCPLHSREGLTKLPLNIRHTMVQTYIILHYKQLPGQGAKWDTYTQWYTDTAHSLPKAVHDLGSGFKPEILFISSEPLGHRGWCSERVNEHASS